MRVFTPFVILYIAVAVIVAVFGLILGLKLKPTRAMEHAARFDWNRYHNSLHYGRRFVLES
jgi:hypothetical protein